jgi:hypothetical protein
MAAFIKTPLRLAKLDRLKETHAQAKVLSPSRNAAADDAALEAFAAAEAQPSDGMDPRYT